MEEKDTKIKPAINFDETMKMSVVNEELTEPELTEEKEEETVPETIPEEGHDEEVDISGELDEEEIEAEKTKKIDIIETTELPVVDESLFETTTISKVDLDTYVNKKEKNKSGRIDKENVVTINPDEVDNPSVEKESSDSTSSETNTVKFAITSFLAYASSVLFTLLNVIANAMLQKGYATAEDPTLYKTICFIAMFFLILTVVLAIIAEVQVLLKKKKGTFLVILSGLLLLVGTFLSEAIATLLT